MIAENETGPDGAAVTSYPSLRQRKCARTKLALVRAALGRMAEKRFDAITVKELCEDAELSEATFFNYFPKKDDLLRYYVRLWAIELGQEAERVVGAHAGLEYLEQVFEQIGKQVEDNPNLLLQVLRYLVQNPTAVMSCERQSLNVAERMHALPEIAESHCNVCGIMDVLLPPLRRAIEQRQLGATLDVDAALLALLNTLCGVPLWLGESDKAAVRPSYARQLRLLWTGMRAGACCHPHPPESP